MPLFLFPGRHIQVPLEATYQTTWGVLPRELQVIVETGVMPADEDDDETKTSEVLKTSEV